MPDMNDAKLRTEISELIGIPYLQPATKDEADKIVTGLIYGDKYRVIFPCVVGYKSKAYWIFFLLDLGAPVTYLSSQVRFTLSYLSAAIHRLSPTL